MPLAVTVEELRRSAESMPRLKLPETFTDPDLASIIERKTNVALAWGGQSLLPSDPVFLGVIQDAVMQLSILEVQRRLRPDDLGFLSVIAATEAAMRRSVGGALDSLLLVQEQGETSGAFLDWVGGPEDG